MIFQRLRKYEFLDRIATCMAKKGARELVGMVCTICKSQNYVTERNKVNMDTKGKGKLQINKFCKKCKKHTLHKETSKLK